LTVLWVTVKLQASIKWKFGEGKSWIVLTEKKLISR